MNQNIKHEDQEENEIDFKEIIKIIQKFKWSILFITFVTTLLTLVYLYFQPSIYRSSALIEVKSNLQNSIIDENQPTFAAIGQEKIDKEIEILKTFYINNKVLDKVNLRATYHIDSGYKKVEIYKDIPISIKDITIFENKIIGKMLQITPLKDGYTLSLSKSFWNKLSIKYNPWHKEEEDFTFENKKYEFNQMVETPYFALTVVKKHTFDKPIYTILKGNNKNIFDSVINDLNVYQVTDSAPLIRVEFEDNILERADEYVNTLIDSFIERSIEDKGKKTEEVIEFINKQLVETKNKLNEYELKLEKYKIVHNAIQPSLQGTTYINELSQLDNEISNYKLKQQLILKTLNTAKRNNDINTLATSLLKLDDQPTMSLIEKLQEIQIKEEELRAKYSYMHPSLRPIKKQIYHIQKNIIKNIKNLNSRINQKIKSLKKLKASYKLKLDSLPTKERELVGLKRDYEVSAKIYDNLLKKKSENQILKVAIQSDYRVIDYANNTQAIPVRPKRLPTLLFGIIIGLLLGVFLAFIRNYFDDKINSKKEIEELTTLPLYGILPEIKKKNIKLEVLEDPKSPYAESYRSLRTNLQFTQSKDNAHVILVSSTIMGEGKSTTVANLSAIFNLAGYKCVVINLDLRKPTLHKFFNVDNSVGMSTYLSGRSKIEDIISPTEYEDLDIITSGPIPPNPSELILSEKMGELIDTLKENYDYIFIDSAPLGLVTDTMNLMQYAHINLIIFREKYALKSFVKDLNSLVERHDLKHIGLVLNGSDMRTGAYGYGYGY
jgi:capsular exopolysaccharide synthesis family protein